MPLSGSSFSVSVIYAWASLSLTSHSSNSSGFDLSGLGSVPSTMVQSWQTSSTVMMRYFHIWKFDPSFSRDGISYNRLEPCATFVVADALAEDIPHRDGAWEAEGVLDMVLKDCGRWLLGFSTCVWAQAGLITFCFESSRGVRTRELIIKSVYSVVR